RRELFQRLRHLSVVDAEVAIRIERRNVLVDAKTHCLLLDLSDPTSLSGTHPFGVGDHRFEETRKIFSALPRLSPIGSRREHPRGPPAAPDRRPYLVARANP